MGEPACFNAPSYPSEYVCTHPAAVGKMPQVNPGARTCVHLFMCVTIALMRLFLIAGEASGDLHGAALAQQLLSLDSSLQLEGLGGPRMAAAGVDIRLDLTRYAVIGFTALFRLLLKFRRIFLDTCAYLLANPPDAVILIDYPGFNLRLARRLKAAGIPVIDFITPQVWAWKPGRKHAMARDISLGLSILPFEPAIFAQVGMPDEYVGNPLLDHLAVSSSLQEARQKLGVLPDQPLIGLLPGSRTSEVRTLWPTMLRTAELLQPHIPTARFLGIVSESVPPQLYDIPTSLDWTPVAGPAWAERAALDVALTASGTAVLENGLLNVPTVVVYQTSPVNAWLVRHILRLPYISLPNIIAGRFVYPEYLQDACRPEWLCQAMLMLFVDSDLRNAVLDGLAIVRRRLGPPGAAARAAASILSFLQQPPYPGPLSELS